MFQREIIIRRYPIILSTPPTLFLYEEGHVSEIDWRLDIRCPLPGREVPDEGCKDRLFHCCMAAKGLMPHVQ